MPSTSACDISRPLEAPSAARMAACPRSARARAGWRVGGRDQQDEGRGAEEQRQRTRVLHPRETDAAARRRDDDVLAQEFRTVLVGDERLRRQPLLQRRREPRPDRRRARIRLHPADRIEPVLIGAIDERSGAAHRRFLSDGIQMAADRRTVAEEPLR